MRVSWNAFQLVLISLHEPSLHPIYSIQLLPKTDTPSGSLVKNCSMSESFLKNKQTQAIFEECHFFWLFHKEQPIQPLPNELHSTSPFIHNCTNKSLPWRMVFICPYANCGLTCCVPHEMHFSRLTIFHQSSSWCSGTDEIILFCNIHNRTTKPNMEKADDKDIHILPMTKMEQTVSRQVPTVCVRNITAKWTGSMLSCNEIRSDRCY